MKLQENDMIVDNVLPAGFFNAIQNTARTAHYTPLERGNDTSIYVASCAKFFERYLNEVIRKELGDFRTIVSYFRQNNPEVDTGLRIHSDKEILGQQPTHGVVYYLDIEEGGTGFYDHKVYGDRLPLDVNQPEQEYGNPELWKFRDFIEGKPNRMISYPSNMFHQRYPTVSTGNRLVWVSFIMEKNNDIRQSS